MLKSLRSLFKPKAPDYGFTKEEVKFLREIKSEPSFTILLDLCETLQEESAEALIGTTDSNQIHYLRGVIQGLRMPFLTIERLTEDNDRERDPERKRELERQRTILATYGTHFWRATEGI